MRKMMLGAALLGAVAIVTSANATPIAAGGSVTAAPIALGTITVLATYNNVAFTSQAPAGQPSTFSGTYTASVFRDKNNTLCGSAGQCLTFAIQVNNNSSSRDGLETVTAGSFSDLFTYDVGYNSANGGIAPLFINDSTTGIISFNFTRQSNTANMIMPGQSSDYLLIQSSATNYTFGNISFQDSQTATVAGFIPAVAVTAAVPEPASWAMMILGMGAVGFMLRRKVRASEVKFDAKIKRISEGATA